MAPSSRETSAVMRTVRAHDGGLQLAAGVVSGWLLSQGQAQRRVVGTGDELAVRATVRGLG